MTLDVKRGVGSTKRHSLFTFITKGYIVMKIYYMVAQEIELDDNLSDVEIDNAIAEIADGRDYMWSKEDNLLDE